MAKPRPKAAKQPPAPPKKEAPKKAAPGRGSVSPAKSKQPLAPDLRKKFEQRKGVKVETMKGSVNV